MCLFRKCQLQSLPRYHRGLAKPPKAQFTHVNEYFGGKRNAASGTLWTDTNYCKFKRVLDIKSLVSGENYLYFIYVSIDIYREHRYYVPGLELLQPNPVKKIKTFFVKKSELFERSEFSDFRKMF